MTRPIIAMRGIVKRYFIGTPNEIEVLHHVDLTVMPGEFVAIVGASGSGKSTLMNIIGALDRPTEGDYTLDGLSMADVPEKELSHIRNRKIGFVFQSFNLISRNTAKENVALPLLYAGVPAAKRNARAEALLNMVGMLPWENHHPNELSGGQNQRVAIARAMACDPAILLADEPTGALDSKTGRLVMDIFHHLHKNQHKTIVLITHNDALAEEADRVVRLTDGDFVEEHAGKQARRALH